MIFDQKVCARDGKRQQRGEWKQRNNKYGDYEESRYIDYMNLGTNMKMENQNKNCTNQGPAKGGKGKRQ